MNSYNALLKKIDLDYWLYNSGLPVQRIGRNKWAIGMSHQLAKYPVEVSDHGDWISFAAAVGRIKPGDNSGLIDRIALELNASLNAAHIAIKDNTIVLLSNELAEDTREDKLYRDLTNFHKTHEYVYLKMLEAAENKGIQIDLGGQREAKRDTGKYLTS